MTDAPASDPPGSSAYHRGSGSTSSERYLARLADRTFLDLWSYPNVYRDVSLSGGRTAGKEVCDLLVVCGDHVLIFSDKEVAWPSAADVNVAWSRWYRQAVKKSVSQVRGAQRWIDMQPDRLFLDAACKRRIPLDLPPMGRRRVHGILVATGAAEACRNAKGGSGSLSIKPALLGDAHIHPSASAYEPFAIGDCDPNGPFVHVLDEVSLDILMQELDTISDFTAYLERKADLVRSGRLESAAGEEDLLAWYLTSLNADGERDFGRPGGGEWLPEDKVNVAGDVYSKLKDHPQYKARKIADRDSYYWDRLITAFTKNILGGTLEEPGVAGIPLATDIKEMEQGVRYMALENRLGRRLNGAAIRDALSLELTNKQRFFRGMLPKAGANRDTAFGLLLLPQPADVPAAQDYNNYRRVRSNMLGAYGLNFLLRHREVKRFVGVAMEPPIHEKGSSEDMAIVEVDEWTPEMLAEAERMRDHFKIFAEGVQPEYEMSVKDFPDLPKRPAVPARQRSRLLGSPPMNRHQRRALEAARRKGR